MIRTSLGCNVLGFSVANREHCSVSNFHIRCFSVASSRKGLWSETVYFEGPAAEEEGPVVCEVSTP